MSCFDQFETDNALWTFATDRFVVEIHAIEEDTDPADSFEFDDDIAFARSGNPSTWFEAVVVIRDIGSQYVVGCSTLGGCSYNSFQEFYQSHRDKDPMNRNCTVMRVSQGQNVSICHYFPDMIREAIRDARAYCGRYKGIKDVV